MASAVAHEGGGDSSKLIFWGVVGLGAVWLIYQLIQKIGGSVSNLTQPASQALANWYVQLTAGGQAIPQGYALLPNGSSVSLASVSVTSVPNPQSPAGISGTFQYAGQTYYLNSSHDQNGNYAASTSLSYP